MIAGVYRQYTPDEATTRPEPEGRGGLVRQGSAQGRRARHPRPVPVNKLLCGVSIVRQ